MEDFRWFAFYYFCLNKCNELESNPLEILCTTLRSTVFPVLFHTIPLMPTQHQVRPLYLYTYCNAFFNSHIGGWNWVHSARRPLNGLLYLPWVIVMMENLVKWRLAGETEVLGENLPPAPLCPPHLTCQTRARTRAAAVGNQRLTASAKAAP
jgi:hypothetical protein